uniref:Uncharacterized protein n=1 Tax=Oryza glumipatula TaxID=40148 RepID=A0A0D9YA78_9ORYZ
MDHAVCHGRSTVRRDDTCQESDGRQRLTMNDEQGKAPSHLWARMSRPMAGFQHSLLPLLVAVS